MSRQLGIPIDVDMAWGMVADASTAVDGSDLYPQPKQRSRAGLEGTMPTRLDLGRSRGLLRVVIRRSKCYRWCYHGGVAVVKRSVSLDAEVAAAAEAAATEDGVSFSAWLSGAAHRQLLVREGLRGVAEWETDAGPLSPGELAAGEVLLDRLLSGGPHPTVRTA